MPRLSPDQLAARRLGIGSSDVPAILDLPSYVGRNAWAVWNEKRGLSEEPSPELQEVFDRGHDLEPVIARWYARRTKAELLPGGTIQKHGEPWAFATIDAKVIALSCGLECKAVGVSKLRDWDETRDDGIPDYVRVQCVWQMYCADYAAMHVAAMLGGPAGFRVFEVVRDVELEDQIVRRCRAFWGTVVEGKPPAIDGSAACRAYLENRYPRPTSLVMRAATPEEERIAAERHGAAIQEKIGERVKKEMDNKLIALIEERTGIEGADGWKATRKVGKGDVCRYRFAPAKSWKGGGEDE